MKRLFTVLLFSSMTISQAPMLAMNSNENNERDNKKRKLNEIDENKSNKKIKLTFNLGLSNEIWQKIFSFLFSQHNQQPFSDDHENKRALSVLLKTNNQFNQTVWSMFTNTPNDHMAPLLNHFLANCLKNRRHNAIRFILSNQTFFGFINAENANRLLGWACENGYNTIVLTLLANTIILGLIDANGANKALDSVCKNDHNTILQNLLANTTILGLINTNGANQALESACILGHNTIVLTLLANTTILGLINANDANYALTRACKNDHNTILQNLLANPTILGLITNEIKQNTLEWTKNALKYTKDDQIDTLKKIIEILEPSN